MSERPWQAQESAVIQTLTSGRSVIFAGGRGVGTTTLVRYVAQTLADAGNVSVKLVQLYDGSPVLRDVASVVREILDLSHDDKAIPSVPEVVGSVCEGLAVQSHRLLIVLVDGVHLLGRQEWGVPVTEFLRAVVSECDQLVLGLFGRPSLDLLFDAATSPLSNLCARISARPADAARVRESYEVLGEPRAVAMKAHRITGGLPALIPDAVVALQDNDSAQAARSVAELRHTWLASQFGDLSPLAADALFSLCEGALTADGLRQRIGGGDANRVLSELESHLLVRQEPGQQIVLASRVHAVWLQAEGAQRAALSRPHLSIRDQEAYRTLSELEWYAREWLSRRLLAASSSDWWTARVPKDPRRRAEERWESEKRAGSVVASSHVVDYLDFTDIREVIRFGPNWNDAFKEVLGEWRAALDESLRRLEAMRRKVAHSRPLSAEELTSLQRDAMLVRELINR